MTLKIGLLFFFVGVSVAVNENYDVVYQKYQTCKEGTACVPFNDCIKIVVDIRISPRTSPYYETARDRNCGYDGVGPRVCCAIDEKNFKDSSQSTTTNKPNNNNNNNTSNNSKNNNNNNNNKNNTNNNNNNNNNYDNNSKNRNDNGGNGADTPIQNLDVRGVATKNELLPANCGKDLTEKIVGGNVTGLQEFTWTAGLEFQTPAGLRLGCGGSLINNKYVLTAAHCVYQKNLPRGWVLKSVRLGEYNTESDPDCIPDGDNDEICSDKVISIEIEEKIVHESYNASKDQHHDIALLRLKQPAKFSPSISAICLPNDDQLGSNFIAAGWGLTELGINSPVKLKVTLPIVTDESCRSTYAKSRPIPRKLADSQLCAGGQQGKDSCKGDSGGPLMMIKRNKIGEETYFIAGVVSYGPTPCAQESWPGVYTKVFHYKSWIMSKLRA